MRGIVNVAVILEPLTVIVLVVTVIGIDDVGFTGLSVESLNVTVRVRDVVTVVRPVGQMLTYEVVTTVVYAVFGTDDGFWDTLRLGEDRAFDVTVGVRVGLLGDNFADW